MKTDKSTLRHKLESMQTTEILDIDMSVGYAYVIDEGYLLHSVMSQANGGASCASIASVYVICSGKASEDLFIC